MLDGGTDFGHPDLIGTWKTWSGLTGPRAGWNGWPMAFDPYGTLIWLAAPNLVHDGLCWYTKTTAASCPGLGGQGRRRRVRRELRHQDRTFPQFHRPGRHQAAQLPHGAPGFGTTAPPSPSAGIAVGASTQFGGTGWDSIDRASQIVDNDVMVWSNRGPGATGSPGVDVVADGAFSAGDVTLNAVLNGQVAWNTWGGTSRSAPVAAGATALIYEAWRDSAGSIPAGFYRTAKDILKSSAQDLGYDSMIQGAGSVDAAEAVAAAAGEAGRVSPNEWRVGDYRGDEYPVFAHTIAPGGSDSQAFAISGSGTWNVSDRQLVRTDTETFLVLERAGFQREPVQLQRS